MSLRFSPQLLRHPSTLDLVIELMLVGDGNELLWLYSPFSCCSFDSFATLPHQLWTS